MSSYLTNAMEMELGRQAKDSSEIYWCQILIAFAAHRRNYTSQYI